LAEHYEALGCWFQIGEFFEAHVVSRPVLCGKNPTSPQIKTFFFEEIKVNGHYN